MPLNFQSLVGGHDLQNGHPAGAIIDEHARESAEDPQRVPWCKLSPEVKQHGDGSKGTGLS